MIDKFLSIIAPHICCGCGQVGTLLCDSCKYNITSDRLDACLVCLKPCGVKGICSSCKVPYDRAWFVGLRRDALQRLVGLYKFERAKSAYTVLGDLIISSLPQLPSDVIVVPIPTVRGHIRERGYDHTLLIAKYIANKLDLTSSRSLVRATSTKQRQATAGKRQVQASKAFAIAGAIDSSRPYLLIDDVVTTGATLKYASHALKQAGASQVWVTVIARQTLD